MLAIREYDRRGQIVSSRWLCDACERVALARRAISELTNGEVRTIKLECGWREELQHDAHPDFTFACSSCGPDW